LQIINSYCPELNLYFGGNKMKKSIIIAMILMFMFLISCANMSSSEKGALTGAGVGAAGGAALTAIAGGNAAVGAAIGGAAGAVAGGLIGGNKEKKE
jgi:membrane associated rhomboid family serine protease